MRSSQIVLRIPSCGNPEILSYLILFFPLISGISLLLRIFGIPSTIASRNRGSLSSFRMFPLFCCFWRKSLCAYSAVYSTFLHKAFVCWGILLSSSRSDVWEDLWSIRAHSHTPIHSFLSFSRFFRSSKLKYFLFVESSIGVVSCIDYIYWSTVFLGRYSVLYLSLYVLVIILEFLFLNFCFAKTT